jgi:hypothetical protein
MGEIAASYRYTVPALREAGFRVAVMDLRGHGESDATFTTYDDVAAGTDILALIAHLGGPPSSSATRWPPVRPSGRPPRSPPPSAAWVWSARSSATRRPTRSPPQRSAC